MPKIKWLKSAQPSPPPPVKADYLGDLLTRYMRQRKITYAALAPKVGMTASSAKCKKSHGTKRFKLNEFFSWCKILDVPEEDVAAAVALAYRDSA